MKIPTNDAKGDANGYVIEVWSERTSDYRPSQVYVTAIYAGARKGPHLHRMREGRFCCISGNCDIICRNEDGVYFRFKDMGLNHLCVHVAPGTAAEIICTSTGWEPAILINMPMPAWDPNDLDEWPVENWAPNV